jgi:hypothetical protein
VVRRKSLKVNLPELRRVKPDPDLVERVLLGIKDASEDAHYEPHELQAPPLSPDDLEALLEEFVDVWHRANPNYKPGDTKVTQLRPIVDDVPARGTGGGLTYGKLMPFGFGSAPKSG